MAVAVSVIVTIVRKGGTLNVGWDGQPKLSCFAISFALYWGGARDWAAAVVDRAVANVFLVPSCAWQ